ncbi:MAG: peptide/nickel transport system substrate-binding protein [Candidatus Azotimanducaceae bacterium]|jgi:peptide/nickel transport system substrate-binding protein
MRLFWLMYVVVGAAVGLSANNVSAETPEYGGDLNIGTVNVTLSPLSWDPADWTWKSNHDAGGQREQLFAGDLDKSVRKGGIYPFISDAYLPTESIRGELAESWVWEGDLTLVISLRRNAMFTDRPGVMKARLLEAQDVVFSYDLVDQSPKRIPTYFDHIKKVYARDKHTVVFEFSEFNAEWMYRFGYGYYSSISPRELGNVDRKDWRNTSGTGPFILEKYVQANAHIYRRNDNYWDKETIDGQQYSIPFVNKVIYRIIKDEATYLTALRTGQLDILEAMRWIAVDHLKETTPELKWNRWLATSGTFMALRVDQKPFDDIRVRRALNLAINQKEIAELFYGGYAELMAYPQHPGFGEYFEPLEEMPQEVQALFTYNPEKARALLKEAGVPKGFTFDVQVCSCSPSNMDMIPLLESYLQKVGISIKIKPMEYASFLSAMTTKTHGPGYLLNSGHVNPITTLRKSFVTGQTWNPSQYSSKHFDEQIRLVHLERDEKKRIVMLRELTRLILAEAPYIWLPTAYNHTAWWPWVKNYGGELRVGAVRPGPIYGRIWIDEKLKAELGFD